MPSIFTNIFHSNIFNNNYQLKAINFIILTYTKLVYDKQQNWKSGYSNMYVAM